jgi:hypothetical protein
MTGNSFAMRLPAVLKSESESFGFPNLTYLIRTSSVITSGTSMSESNLPDWEQLLSAAAHLQEILPGATHRKHYPSFTSSLTSALINGNGAFLLKRSSLIFPPHRNGVR